MRHKVKLPKLGDTTESVIVLEWLVKVGDTVGVGDALMRAETDKIDADVPSPIAGVVVECLVAVQNEIATGEPVAVIETD